MRSIVVLGVNPLPATHEKCVNAFREHGQHDWQAAIEKVQQSNCLSAQCRFHKEQCTVITNVGGKRTSDMHIWKGGNGHYMPK